MSDEQIDVILGLRPDGKVCRRDSHYDSTVDSWGVLTHDPRLHDPIDGLPCKVETPV